MPSSKRKRSAVVLIETGPSHNYHICKNHQCRSLVRVNYPVTRHFPSRLISTCIHDPNGNGGDVYSNPCDEVGYECPNCHQFHSLWPHLGEYTSEDLASRHSKRTRRTTKSS